MRPETWQESVDMLCEYKDRVSRLTPRSILHYRQDLNGAMKRLEAAGRPTLPWEIRSDDIRWLEDKMIEDDLAVSTRRSYSFAIKHIMQFFDNPEYDTRILRSEDTRPNVKWLNTEQTRALVNIQKNPLEDLVIHCELYLGLRRIEVIRLTTSSFQETYVDVTGKGHRGGKMRRIPLAANTHDVLDKYMVYRESLVTKALNIDPEMEIPDNLLIHFDNGAIYPFAEHGTGVDKVLDVVSKRANIGHVSNHDLRRTFARALYHAGVRMEAISALLGHNDTATTMKYLGINMDDMKDAMERLTF